MAGHGEPDGLLLTVVSDIVPGTNSRSSQHCHFCFQIFTKHRISSELSRKVRVSKESLSLRLGRQVSSRFKLKWVEEVKLYRKNTFDDCSIA